MKFNIAKKTLIKTANRSGLLMKKYSPEILMIAGVVGIVSATVLACKATLKADEVIDEANKKIEKIKIVKNNDDFKYPKDSYSDSDYKKDLTIVYVQTGVNFVKLYGPSIALGALSIGCILGSHNILKKRNIALAAAYRLVEQSFKDYRKRVVEEYGETIDRNFKYGIKDESIQVTEEDEDGKKKKVKKTVSTIDPNTHSQYARFFDESSPQWSKTPEYNMIFLKCQQNYANDLLQARGHVFLNEVYDMLGIPRSQAGAIVGWVLDNGDNFIDFNIFDLNSEAARNFVNGYERSILLDFNVDGLIYELI